MSNTLFYSFRTNKALGAFKKNNIPVFVFGPLKKDFEEFSKIIEKNNPKIILGFTCIRGKSRSESKTVNCFGRKGKVSKNGADFYTLKKLEEVDFKVSILPTTSFCNWTIYKIRELIERDNLATEVSFVHFNSTDMSKLIELCQTLTNRL